MSLKYRVIERFRGKYSVEAMCEVFEAKYKEIAKKNGISDPNRIYPGQVLKL